MKVSEYPRDFNHAKDGKTARLRYSELRAAQVLPFGATEGALETKFVLEGEIDETDELVSYWLGTQGAKLVSLFSQELALRQRTGKADFEPGELITITQSDAQRPSKTSGRPMWDYSVEFEMAAPKPSALELLLGAGAVPSTGDELADKLADPEIGPEPDGLLAEEPAGEGEFPFDREEVAA